MSSHEKNHLELYIIYLLNLSVNVVENLCVNVLQVEPRRLLFSLETRSNISWIKLMQWLSTIKRRWRWLLPSSLLNTSKSIPISPHNYDRFKHINGCLIRKVSSKFSKWETEHRTFQHTQSTWINFYIKLTYVCNKETTCDFYIFLLDYMFNYITIPR